LLIFISCTKLCGAPVGHVDPMRVLYAPTFDLSTLFGKIIKIFLQLAGPVADFVKSATRAKKGETKNA
jgi:hypothetical protein